MHTRFKIITTVLLFTLGGYATAQSKNDDELLKERSSLERKPGPIERTKTDIKIADLLILLMTDAARTGNDKVLDQHLNAYAGTIQDAQKTMMMTGADAHKHPAGFKELEISLRKQQRRLEDIGKLVDADQREAIGKVKKLASDIDDQLVKTMLLKDSNASRKP